MPRFTAIIQREEKGYVALCPELDIAGRGEMVEEPRNNLTEALEVQLQCRESSSKFIMCAIYRSVLYAPAMICASDLARLSSTDSSGSEIVILILPSESFSKHSESFCFSAWVVRRVCSVSSC